MFHQILCPINFTTFSHRALQRAVEIARSSGATITGIYVADDPVPSADGGSRRAWTTDDLPRMEAQVLKVLQEAKAPSPRAVAVLGTPAREIVKLAGALPADLVVMPSYGRTGRAEHSCGSVTAHVLCHAPAPVLVVPDGTGVGASPTLEGFHRIACGINYSPASLKALRFASDLAAEWRSRLLVTHVLSNEDASAVTAKNSNATGTQDALAVWRRRLHEAAHADVPPGLHVEDYLRMGDPTEEILRLAQDERCDLIVIGGHRGHPPGCVMNAVVSRSPFPVLTVRVSR
jgi:nucleotide-binding universal stress UspA family protein